MAQAGQLPELGSQPRQFSTAGGKHSRRNGKQISCGKGSDAGPNAVSANLLFVACFVSGDVGLKVTQNSSEVTQSGCAPKVTLSQCRVTSSVLDLGSVADDPLTTCACLFDIGQTARERFQEKAVSLPTDLGFVVSKTSSGYLPSRGSGGVAALI